MSWCGYIDMLGTRDMARRSYSELKRSLDNFHSALAANFEHFEDGVCIAFSDGAFFEARDVESFAPFYRRVRNVLFQSGIVFRCSLITGSVPMQDRETDENGFYLDARPPHFRSFTFGGFAPQAYQAESEFKGVGCTVRTQLGAGEEKSGLVPSFFVRAESTRATSVYFVDFAYSACEVSDPAEGKSPSYINEQPLVDQLVISCHSALAQSNWIGSYFLSAFVTIVRSSDMKTTKYDPETGWSGAPYLFLGLIQGGLAKILHDMPGLHLLYLALFAHLYDQKGGAIEKNVERQVLKTMLKVPGCFRNLDRVPDYVISGPARQHLVNLKAVEARLIPSARRKRVIV
jgi:hypothetical protein